MLRACRPSASTSPAPPAWSAVGLDRRLRAGLADDEVATLARLLDRLRDNVAGHDKR